MPSVLKISTYIQRWPKNPPRWKMWKMPPKGRFLDAGEEDGEERRKSLQKRVILFGDPDGGSDDTVGRAAPGSAMGDGLVLDVEVGGGVQHQPQHHPELENGVARCGRQ